MTMTEAAPALTESPRYVTVALAIDAAKADGFDVFVRGSKKTVAVRVVGTGKKASIETMFLAGGEGERYWALMRAA